MSSIGELHLDRQRAESFGSAAQDYDRYRPTLIDDLVALRGTDALDVGCETGRVARLLAGRGLSVLGVELDACMAAVARGYGVRVELTPFEDWDDAGWLSQRVGDTLLVRVETRNVVNPGRARSRR